MTYRLDLGTYVPRRSELEEADLQVLVKASQEGNEAATFELLEAFANFLAKYYMLLAKGHFDPSDRDVRTFLSLYTPMPGSRGYMIAGKLNEKGRAWANDLVKRISLMVGQSSEEDIEEVLILAFIHCIQRYEKRDDIGFLGYIRNYYRYILKRYVSQFLLNQHALHTVPLPEENLEEESQGDIGDQLIESKEMDSSIIPDVLEPLTELDRKILVARFDDKEKIRDIAKRFGMSQREVTREIEKATRKLKKSAQSLRLVTKGRVKARPKPEPKKPIKKKPAKKKES